LKIFRLKSQRRRLTDHNPQEFLAREGINLPVSIRQNAKKKFFTPEKSMHRVSTFPS